MLPRVHQNYIVNFKSEIFTWDQAFSYSLRKRNAEKCEIFEIGPCLDLPVSDQSFSMYACMCTIVIIMLEDIINLLRLIFAFIPIISSTIILGKVFWIKYILMKANSNKTFEIYYHIEYS